MKVAVAVQQQAVGAQPVSPGPADLLVIAFDALGQVVVQHKAHVGLVDPHAKGDGGDDDLHIVADEQLLVVFALLIGQPGVIGAHGKPFALQQAGQVIHLVARKAVNDAGLAGKALQELEGLGSRVFFAAHLDEQVFAVEAGDKFVRAAQSPGWL